MFALSLLCLASRRQRVTQQRSLRQRFSFQRSAFQPFEQVARNQRLETMRDAKYGPNRLAMVHNRERYMKDKSNQTVKNNRLLSMQHVGDKESLWSASQLGLHPKDVLAHGEEVDRYVAPPAPYTPLMARKLAAGEWWPAVNDLDSPALKDVRRLQHVDNMSPSARRVSEAIEYHLRRQLRACPAHIGEKIDWSQFILDRCIASRRSRKLYIVWSTVDPLARMKIEPFLPGLTNWVRRIYLKRLGPERLTPAVPIVQFVYHNGALETAIPRKLLKEVAALHQETNESIEERVSYLESLDSLAARAKGVPWFMPYLWEKDKKLKKTITIREDVKEMADRFSDRKSVV